MNNETWLKMRYRTLENKLIVTGCSGHKVTAYISKVPKSYNNGIGS